MKKEDGFDLLFEALLGGSGEKAILNQESRGQQNLINSQELPRDCDQNAFEAVGFVFGDVTDDLFIQVTLPEGWKKEATDHSMWSIIKDDQGRERVSIFYKAAFYDRSAHMQLTNRFIVRDQPFGGYGNYEETRKECVVTDCGNVVWKSDPVELPQEQERWQERSNITKEIRLAGERWLDENYPNWRDPILSWEY